MTIIFMGTPDFAVPSLRRLVEDGHTIAAVVTQADKPQGRRQQLTPPAVKAYALTEDLPVLQPATLKDEAVYAAMAALEPDMIVVVAYGKLLPRRLLDLPRYGCVNVHASLLPRWRGAAPIQWSILAGDRETGVTTMHMEAGLDTGPILLQSRRAIPDEMTAGELFPLLAQDGASLLSETVRRLAAGDLADTPQPEEGACYASMLTRGDSPIDWSRPAPALHNQVRGLHPWPAATCRLGEKAMRIHVSRVGAPTAEPAGTVIGLSPLTVACGQGTSLELLEIQAEGSRRMAAAEYLRGHPVTLGMKAL